MRLDIQVEGRRPGNGATSTTRPARTGRTPMQLIRTILERLGLDRIGGPPFAIA